MIMVGPRIQFCILIGKYFDIVEKQILGKFKDLNGFSQWFMNSSHLASKKELPRSYRKMEDSYRKKGRARRYLQKKGLGKVTFP